MIFESFRFVLIQLVSCVRHTRRMKSFSREHEISCHLSMALCGLKIIRQSKSNYTYSLSSTFAITIYAGFVTRMHFINGNEWFHGVLFQRAFVHPSDFLRENRY